MSTTTSAGEEFGLWADTMNFGQTGEPERQRLSSKVDRVRPHPKSVLVIVAAVFLSSCGAKAESAFDVLSGRTETSDYVVGPPLLELLTEPNSDLLVIQGTVEAVDRGIGMSWTFDNDSEQRHLTDFDDPQASVRSVHVTMTIDRLLAGTADHSSDVRFGLIVDDPDQHDTLHDGLTGEQFVAFLTRSELWSYENDLYGVMVDGALLCRTEGEGLDCPALEEGLASSLELDAAAATLLPLGGSGLRATEPALPFENPELAGLCQDQVNDFAEGEPSPASTEEEAANLLVIENSILHGLEVRDGKIVHRGEQVGSYQIVERPDDTFAVESAEWCYPSD